MSEIEEPPAKVLKIDNIDGVTHVTEVSELPEGYDGAMQDENMGEESGIIEGGADLEQGEGQEEWLSEGILTDDDFNPASQGESERTDSQLGTSNDEDNANNSMEVLDTTAESEAHAAESEANITSMTNEDHTENAANMQEENSMEGDEAAGLNNIESETYTQNYGLECENKPKITKDKANTTESKAKVTEIKAKVTESKTKITESKGKNTESNAKIIQIKTKVVESTAKVTQSKTKVAESKAKITEITAKNTIGQENGGSNVQEKEEWLEQNIEETMKHLDGTKEVEPEPVVDNLVEKTEIITEKKLKAEVKEESDGNDTDDLLRMLGEDDSMTKKKLTKTVKDIRMAAKMENASSDDDDFVYEGATITKLKAAKTALAKRQPMKAEPEATEEDDETEESGEEVSTMKKMFNLRVKATAPTKLNSQKSTSTPTKVVVKQSSQTNVVKLIERPNLTVQNKPRQYQNKRLTSPSVLKPTPTSMTTPITKTIPIASTTLKTATPVLKTLRTTLVTKTTPVIKTTVASKTTPVIKTTVANKTTPITKTTHITNPTPATRTNLRSFDVKKEPEIALTKYPVVRTPAPFKPAAVKVERELKEEPHDTIREEFIDDDNYDMGEDEFGDSDLETPRKDRQRIMRPEMMDEEVPSDEESLSGEGSLYDELPSSESEDSDDWFQLDIRAEKAGDYLPLLGSKAKELLLEEKRRVSERLKSLTQSHAALCESGKKQAQKLRDATMALAELDDLLKAS